MQVALRIKSKGGNARAGDVISYVFCLAEGEETAKTAQADRAKHPDEVRRAGSDLKIGENNFIVSGSLTEYRGSDFEHYLSQQVLPPIERLCEPIEGTDRARLAECLGAFLFFRFIVRILSIDLGLDPGRYRNSASGAAEDRSFSTLDSQLSDAERFKDATPFLVRCRHCQGQLPFVAITDRDVRFVPWFRLEQICMNDMVSVFHPAHIRTYMSLLSRASGYGQFASAARNAGQRTYRKVLRRLDSLRRSHLWASYTDDGCLWSEVFTTRMPRQCFIRGIHPLVVELSITLLTNLFHLVLRCAVIQSTQVLFFPFQCGQHHQGNERDCSAWCVHFASSRNLLTFSKLI